MYRAFAQGKSLWHALLSSKVGLIFVVTFFYASLSYASAQSQDVTPPTLTAFSFLSPTIDTSAGPAVGAVSVAATDNLAGVLEVIVQLLSLLSNTALRPQQPSLLLLPGLVESLT